MNMSQLNDLAPKINWTVFFDSAYAALNQPVPLPVVVNAPTFFGNLSQTLERLNGSSRQAYMRWHAIRSYASQLDESIVTAYQDFQAVSCGRKEQKGEGRRRAD